MLTPDQQRIVQLISTTTGLCSVIGAGLIIACFIAFKELRTSQSRLVLYLCMNDVVQGLAFIFSVYSDSNHQVCITQSILLQFCGLAGGLWQFCISIYILRVNMQPQKVNLKRQEIFFHLLCWGVPTIFVAITAPMDYYGQSGAWCWFKLEHTNMGVYTLYVPTMVLLLFCAIVYINTALLLRKRKNIDLNSSTANITGTILIANFELKQQLKARFYLIPFACCWIFGFINRVSALISGDSSFALYLLQALFYPLMGFWNFWMCGLTEVVVAPPNMKTLMQTSIGREFFRQFLVEQYASENLMFYEDVERLTHLPKLSTEWTELVTSIFTNYLNSKSAHEVCLHGEIRNQLLTQFNTGVSSVRMRSLLEAQEEVRVVMMMSFPQFRASPLFKEMIKKLKSTEHHYSSKFLIRVFIEQKLCHCFKKSSKSRKHSTSNLISSSTITVSMSDDTNSTASSV